MSDKIKVDSYGDVLALKVDGECVMESSAGGSYQGEYVAVIKASHKVGYGSDAQELPQYYVFAGSYGSCSGCDWLEAERDWDGFIDAKTALDYASQSVPLYILTKKPTKEWLDKLAEKVNRW